MRPPRSSLVSELSEIVVKRAGPHPVVAFGLASHFLHDAVTVQVDWRKSEKNMERGRRQRDKAGRSGCHGRISIYRSPSYAVKRVFCPTLLASSNSRLGFRFLLEFCDSGKPTPKRNELPPARAVVAG